MTAVLRAQKRQSKSSSETKRLRKSGRIPAILYGLDKENEAIHLDQSEVNATFRSEGRNAILELTIEDKPSEKVIVADIQTHPIKDQILHIDFKRIDMSEKMVAVTPLVFTGEAEGVKRGGVLQTQLWEVEVRCLPADLPESISVDISNLEIGDTLTVGDLVVPDGVEIQHDPEEVIASVAAPRLDPTAGTDAEEEAGETSEEASEEKEEQ